MNEVHISTEGNQTAIFRTATTHLGVTQLSNTATTITGLATNGDITLTPNGTGKVAVSSAMEVTGNLTVNGTTTTIDSTTLTIEDPLIQLAKNNSGGSANTFDQGLFFNRGSDDNVSFIWDESADQFAFAITSGEDGTTDTIYPDLGEQLDLLFKAIDADSDLKTKFADFHTAISAVKSKYPKPS